MQLLESEKVESDRHHKQPQLLSKKMRYRKTKKTVNRKLSPNERQLEKKKTALQYRQPLSGKLMAARKQAVKQASLIGWAITQWSRRSRRMRDKKSDGWQNEHET